MNGKRRQYRRPRLKEVEREKRLTRIESMMLRGIKSQTQLAAAFNVSNCQISKDVVEIRQRWKDRDPDLTDIRRSERVAQLEGILQQAMNAWDRSRRDVEEFTINISACSNCNGRGEVEDKPDIWKSCRMCGGRGKHVSEQTKVKETPGDVSFLKVAKECVAEVAKLQGLYPDGKVGILRRVTETEGVGGRIREEIEEMYAMAPTDSLIAAMTAIDALKHSNRKSDQKAVLEATARLAPSYHEGDNGDAKQEPEQPNQQEAE